MTTWTWLSFEELTKNQLYAILALRQEVFVLGQKSFYTDLDYLDQKCMHLLGMQDHQLAAYLRILPKDLVYPNAVSIGRVVTAPFARGQGIGKQLVDEAMNYLHQHHQQIPIVISAQLYLEKFYGLYGFQSQGAPYDEDGILHIEMRKPVSVT